MGKVELHSEVKIKASGLKGEVVGFYQEQKSDPLQALVLYWSNDGDKKEIWMRLDEFELI